MKIIFQRNKCIGCNYCNEADSNRWRMSKKDGKANLLQSQKKGDFWIAEIANHELEANEKAVSVCPVNIIKIL